MKTPTEFGAKYDVSVDEKGHARLEKTSFDSYNESGVFVDAIERYKARTGHYPKRALADQIYRTSKNKHSFGAGLIMTKLEETSLTSIALSVLAAIYSAQRQIIFLYLDDQPDEYGRQYFIEFEDEA